MQSLARATREQLAGGIRFRASLVLSHTNLILKEPLFNEVTEKQCTLR